MDACEAAGINILECFMCEPNIRSNIGKAIKGKRDKWVIMGHFGSVWQGQYVRTRNMKYVKPAFEDLLDRLDTDYIDIGMIHFVDSVSEWEALQQSDFMDYVREMKDKGVVRHLGLSTHNPEVAMIAAQSGTIEMLLFSINPAFDMQPPTENYSVYFTSHYQAGLNNIAPERAELYQYCEQNDIGITVMKCFGGGRLFHASLSPFGVALSPIHCIHYALTRPGVTSVMCGVESLEQLADVLRYENASEEEKDYATVLASAPRHAYTGQCTYCGHCEPCPVHIDIAMINKLYDLAVMQPEIPASVRAHYQALEHHADECIGCGSCEERCPFSVKIVERMKKTAVSFS